MKFPMELIPGLINDLGLECLVRIPYQYFSSVHSVSRSWKNELESPEFWRRRKAAAMTQRVIVMAQARVDPNPKPGSVKYSATPVYRLVLLEPETSSWTELPPVPGYTDGLPMFCRVVGVGLNLVVMGGWNPETWEVTNAVFVYNFVSARWRRAADMPGCRRSFFASASDSERWVFVAGGHDDEKNAVRSALAYDVETDKWTPLPDMAEDRDECKGVFRGGEFHVIGGYQTSMQGRFGKTSEAFDVATWRWGPVKEEFLANPICPRTCVDGGEGRFYICDGGEVVAGGGSTWDAVAKLPDDVREVSYMTAWQGKVMVIGSISFSGPRRCYMLDLEGPTWVRINGPDDFTGNVQSGCCLEL